MNRRLWLGVVALLAVTGFLAACSSDSDMGGMGHSSDDSSAIDSEAAFNQADVTFAQGMIPHHQQAVEMATLAESRAESAEVTILAEQIKGAQDPEIETMQDWLEEWGQELPDGDMSMDMGSGMMSEDDMMSLDDASGAEFDQMFLTMMIKHHEGAIEQAQTELEDGKSTDAKELAQAIVTAQEAEIATMEKLLEAG